MARSEDTGNIRRQPASTSVRLSQIPSRTSTDDTQDDAVTSNIVSAAPATPGSMITVATPQINGAKSNNHLQGPKTGTGSAAEGSKADDHSSIISRARVSSERAPEDSLNNGDSRMTADDQANTTNSQASSGEAVLDNPSATSPTEPKDEKSTTSLFGKKFRMNFPKKLGRSSVEVKQSIIDENPEDSEKSDYKEDRANDQYLLGTVNDIRAEYEAQIDIYPSHDLIPTMNPSLPNDTPELSLPPSTIVLIQEEQPESGATVDLYRGYVSSVGNDTGVIEKFAPRWLGDALLRVID